MKVNTEITKLQHLRMLAGTALAIVGVLLLIVSGVIAFTNLTLTFISIALIFIGLLIAGSHRLGQLIYDLLR